MSEWFATAECRVCGALVTRLEAPLHIEDHALRGEFPTSPAPNLSTTEGEL
jgi:hypothetical protein